MRINILIVNYNTPILVECLIKSLLKFPNNYNIYIFDNSDKYPFNNITLGNITLLDNTRQQIINFDNELKLNPNKWKDVSKYGSMKHCISVDKCFDIIKEPFILLDSDVLIKKDIKELYDLNYAFVGDLQYYDINGCNIRRLNPVCCFINTPLLNGIRFYNRNKMWAMSNKKPNMYYDTGAYFYEEVKNHHLNYKVTDVNNYIEHFKEGSYSNKNYKLWLKKYKYLWDIDKPIKHNKYKINVNNFSMKKNQYEYLINTLEYYKSKNICELGSGVSTDILETYIKDNTASLVSIENNEKYKRKNSIIFPLEEHTSIQIGDIIYNNCNKYIGFEDWLSNQNKFDFVLIDGPISCGYRLNYTWQRVQLLSFVYFDKLTDNAIIFYHDSDRKNGQNTLNEFERLISEKGFTFDKVNVTPNNPPRLTIYFLNK